MAEVGTVREPRGRGTSAVGIRYQATVVDTNRLRNYCAKCSNELH
jgi:hypothetical protein